MTELRNKLGEMEYDGLITALVPEPQVSGGVIAGVTEATTLKRGTILGKADDGKLTVLGTAGATLTADCILCDDVDLEASTDTNAVVYTAGCFDIQKCTVADSYTITEADKDKLRERNIVFKAAFPV